MAEKGVFLGTGRRKKAVARVRLFAGNGKITVNGIDAKDYFNTNNEIRAIESPFEVLGKEGKYDVIVNVYGGGLSGQAEAVRHGISRALVEADEDNRKDLKVNGFLTRDPRMKERKKYGLKKARKAPQYSKR